jgi:hypothetical protein
MITIQSKEEALFYTEKLLDKWVKNKVDIVNNCQTNAIWFHQFIKTNFSNKVYIKCGSIRLPTINQCRFNLFHVWNEVIINGQRIIIDSTRQYILRLELPNDCQYIENEAGYIIKPDILEEFYGSNTQLDEIKVLDKLNDKTNFILIDIHNVKREIIRALREVRCFLQDNQIDFQNLN